MSAPLVSILIPCFNQAHYLERAAQSCLEQTLPEWEAWILNDGSSDNTATAARALVAADGRFHYHEQANAGLAATRNVGLEHARGTYVQFLDADDFLHPDKLALQVELLEQNPRYAYTYCDQQAVADDGVTLVGDYSVGQSRKILTGNILGSLLIGGFFPPVCALVRKSVLDEYGAFTPQLDGHADYELWLRLAANAFECLYLDRKLAYYRQHAASMSKDCAHMDATFVGAIRKICVEFPGPFAEQFLALNKYLQGVFESGQFIQQRAKELSDENQSLRVKLKETPQGKIEVLQTSLNDQKNYCACLEAELAKRNLMIEKLRAKMQSAR